MITGTEMVNLKHSHVMIMGDFNYPDINWDTSTSDSAEDSPSQNFLSTYKEQGLFCLSTRRTSYPLQGTTASEHFGSYHDKRV